MGRYTNLCTFTFNVRYAHLVAVRNDLWNGLMMLNTVVSDSLY